MLCLSPYRPYISSISKMVFECLFAPSQKVCSKYCIKVMFKLCLNGLGKIWDHLNTFVVQFSCKQKNTKQVRRRQICIPQSVSLCCRGSGSVSSLLGICSLPIFASYVYGFLCAGALNGDGWVAPIYAKALSRIMFAEQTHMKRHILPPSGLWPPCSPLSCPGVWVPPVRIQCKKTLR